ncbi:MAG: hypothetical protein AAFW89_02575 [Bacteroidota bacterium]
MASQGEQDRDRLKEEYKEHYRRIKDAKQRLKQAEQKNRIAQAVKNMDANELMNSVDDFLGKVREKVAFTEAKLDLAMDDLDDSDSSTSEAVREEERQEELRKAKAKQTLQQVKAEMGMLYSEIEKHADEIRAEKTIGTKKESDSSANS